MNQVIASRKSRLENGSKLENAIIEFEIILYNNKISRK
jgi:hypothetical protein